MRHVHRCLFSCFAVQPWSGLETERLLKLCSFMKLSADQALAGGSAAELPEVSVPPLWSQNPYLNVDRSVVRTSNLLHALKAFDPSASIDPDVVRQALPGTPDKRSRAWPGSPTSSSPIPTMTPQGHYATARSADGRRKPRHLVPKAEPLRFIPDHGVSQRVSRLLNRNTAEANRLVWNPLRATIAGQGTESLEEGLRGVRLTMAVD